MNIYIRKIFPHDITHEVSVTTSIVKDFFESQTSMMFVGKKSGKSGIVTINNATDPRFGGEYKAILAEEADYKIDDLIVTYKKSKTDYSLEVINNKDSRYETYAALFKANNRHAILYTDEDTNFKEQFRAYIKDVLGLTSDRQVRDLEKLSQIMVEKAVIDKDVYTVSDIGEYHAMVDKIKNSEPYNVIKGERKAVSPNSGLAFDQGMTNYGRFLEYLESKEENEEEGAIKYYTGLDKDDFSRNRIIFGAPGTGKSHKLNNEKDDLIGKDNDTDYERVTFHPDYTYASFVGTYKPVPSTDEEGNSIITYEYVPGPFMRVLAKALENGRTQKVKPYLLIIEEINRANVAAVFGDVFQLLDRDGHSVSEYPIEATEDMKNYLSKELGRPRSDFSKIKIPDNMFIWATMNSADQGVFPMDTAFKRRWDFTYLGINNNESIIEQKTVTLGKGAHQKTVKWNILRKAINNVLLNECKVNEDKLLGPFFIAMKDLPEGSEIDPVKFSQIFKNKVIMYLFDDAAKQKRAVLFDGCETKNLYSAICEEFDEKGVDIFNSSVRSEFTAAIDGEQ